MMRPLPPAAASAFVPLEALPADGGPVRCEGCDAPERLGFLFDYAYQPIVDIATRQVFAHEALVRGPEGQPAPSVLAQVTESNRYRFDQACRVKAIKGAQALGMQQLLSINFLPNAVYKPEVCIRTTLEAARAAGFPLDHIVFEVTEGERVQDGPWFAQILREYKRCGFKTAIDDFGAGYAGLKLLADFQPDLIKIDMDLVRDIDTRRPRQSIVRALMQVCRDLGIQVIAEGIETPAERDFLADEGVRLMQGYLFARPAFRALAEVDSAAWPSLGR